MSVRIFLDTLDERALRYSRLTLIFSINGCGFPLFCRIHRESTPDWDRNALVANSPAYRSSGLSRGLITRIRREGEPSLPGLAAEP